MTSTRTPEPPPPEPADTAAMLTMFRAIGFALSARAILLLTLIGAFVLAVLAINEPSDARLWVLIAYGSLAVLPVVALEIFKRR